MQDFLTWMASSALGDAIRGSGPWTYALINLAHILGVGALFGAVVILDLRLLGVWRRVPLLAVTETAAPVAAAGFCLAALTGVALLAANATEYAGNPFFLVKFPAIVLGLVNAWMLQRSSAWRARGTASLSARDRRRLAVSGGVSLACWLTAVAMGRMIGYW